MTRLGFDLKDAQKVYNKVSGELSSYIEGIYTHFATADEGELSYAERQLKDFNTVIKKAVEETGAPIVDSRMYNRNAFFNLNLRQRWNYGDGVIEEAINPSHFYPTDGPYVVVQKVRMLNWSGQVGSQLCESSATQIIKEKEPNIVIHLAALAGVRNSLINPERYAQVNIIGFIHLLEQFNIIKSN